MKGLIDGTVLILNETFFSSSREHCVLRYILKTVQTLLTLMSCLFSDESNCEVLYVHNKLGTVQQL